MSNSAIHILPNMKLWHTDTGKWCLSISQSHWRTGELPFFCNELRRVVQPAFLGLWFLHPPFFQNLKPLSDNEGNLDLSPHHAPMQGKVVIKEGWGALVGLQGIWILRDAVQNPNRVQNINIPSNLLFPYIICLIKKKGAEKNLMCDYSDREWVPTALWMAFYLIPLVKTVN